MSEFSTLNGYKVKDKKAIRFYDNIESMTNDTTLKEGMYIKTKGYYVANDGGSAEYYITSTESETEHQEQLNNNLYATLICKEVYPEMYGAKGDGETDDTQAWKDMLSSGSKLLIKSTSDKVYVINEKLNLSAYQELDLGNATITTNNENLDYILNVNTSDKTGGIMHNVVIDCNNLCGGISVQYGTVYTIQHVRVINFITYGINVLQGDIVGINLLLRNNSYNQNSVGISVSGTDSKFYDVLIRDTKIGIENLNGINYFTGVHAWLGLDFSSDDSVAFYINGQASLTNCYADTYNTAIVNDNANLLLVEGFKVYINPTIYNEIATKPPVFIDFVQSSTETLNYVTGAEKTYLYSFNLIMNSNFTPKFSNSTLNDIMRYLPLKKIAQNRSPFNLVDYYETEFTISNNDFNVSKNKIKLYDDKISIDLQATPKSASVSSLSANSKIIMGTFPSTIPNIIEWTHTLVPCIDQDGAHFVNTVAVSFIKQSATNAINFNYLNTPSAYGVRVNKTISI